MSDEFSEPDKDQLITDTARYLSAYVGEIEGVRSIAENIEPDLRVHGITDLLEYHFLRTRNCRGGNHSTLYFDTRGHISDTSTGIGVLDFVDGISEAVGQIKSTNRKDRQLIKNGIEGSVDWNQTYKHRRSATADASQDYVCRVTTRSLSTPRNRILFKLLTTIKDIYERFDQSIKKNESDRPSWFNMWEPGSSARNDVESALSSVNFKSLEKDSISVSQRELRDVANDRNKLYRQAAGLLSAYRRFTGDNVDEDFARSLLGSDVFEPEEAKNSLFELYWIFRIVEAFSESQLEQIRNSGRGRLIARWSDGESDYKLFNDWNGIYTPEPGEKKQKLLDFTPPDHDFAGDLDSTADEATLRRAYITRYTQQIRQNALKYNPSRQFPDIVVIECDSNSGKLRNLFIGEVKHSIGKGYLRENAQQVVEYGMYARTGEDLELAESSRGSDFIAGSAGLATSNIEIAYFVGHKNSINHLEEEGISVYGFRDDPSFSFID